ncbi:MAG: hypothetical protein ACLR60_08545 [Clostridium paraputrificum]
MVNIIVVDNHTIKCLRLNSPCKATKGLRNIPKYKIPRTIFVSSNLALENVSISFFIRTPP